MSKDFNDFMNTQDDSMLYDTQDVQNNKIWAALSYVGDSVHSAAAGKRRQSRYAKYHANQGFILFLAEAVVIIANAILGKIPLLGGISLCPAFSGNSGSDDYRNPQRCQWQGKAAAPDRQSAARI